jgi:uncharacterized protein YutE (UPF0331/DUF86 family)
MLGEREQERLMRHLDFFAGELGDYPTFSAYTWNDYQFDRNKRRNLERWIENLTNSAIDMAKILLASEDFPMPQSYKGILFAFGQKFFDEQFARKIEKWAILRNVVTHEYLDIRWNAIREFLTESRPLLDDVQRTVREAVDGAKG